MYCKECGTAFQSDASSVCLECGTKKGNGKKYCDNCGTEKKRENQDVCLECGKDFKKLFGNFSSGSGDSNKTKLVMLLLWFFLGSIGVHCFYAGLKGRGFIYVGLFIGMFFTCGLTSIGTLILGIIDLVKLLTDKFEDGDGNIITQWT